MRIKSPYASVRYRQSTSLAPSRRGATHHRLVDQCTGRGTAQTARRSDDPDAWPGRALRAIPQILTLVLHQCIRPRIGASLVLRAAMDISARSISLADRPRIGGPKGSPVFDRAGKTVLHLIDFSRRPRQVNLDLHGGGILLFIHPISLVRSRLSPVPTCRLLTALRAGLVEAGRRSDLAAMCAP